MNWPKTHVDTPEGRFEAIAPQIISASRSTDMPAFHAEWLFAHLSLGYAKWTNPFNGRVQYISFENVRAIVFWSKNPKPIIPFLRHLEKRNIAYYFQFTLNDYDDERLEPCVPSLDARLRTFKEIADLLGKRRVIWRFDPLILSDNITIDKLVQKVKRVGDTIHRYTEKLVFSFADIERYAKVKNKLVAANVQYREFDRNSVAEIAEQLSKLAKQWGIKISTCGEAVELSQFDISHNKCIDDELLLKISNNDRVLAELFGKANGQGELFNLRAEKNKSLKDPGQRKECLCVFSKDIGEYNTCPHMCTYCYANTSQKVVEKKMKEFNLAKTVKI